jgi:hypothetical protein
MIYSAWGVDGVANTLIAGTQLPEHDRKMEPLIQMIRQFEAPSWDDAMRQYHEWQGWEPYKPMVDVDEASAEDGIPRRD